MMEFLYFPEDKTEYLPSVIVLVIFMLLAVGAMYLIYKKSKKEEELFNEKYSQHNIEEDENSSNENY